MPNSIFFLAISCCLHSQTSKKSLPCIHFRVTSNALETVLIRSSPQTLSFTLSQRELLILSSLRVSSLFTCRLHSVPVSCSLSGPFQSPPPALHPLTAPCMLFSPQSLGTLLYGLLRISHPFSAFSYPRALNLYSQSKLCS